MNEQVRNNQEVAPDDMGMAIMGFSMGTMAIGGIWFLVNFMWDLAKLLG